MPQVSASNIAVSSILALEKKLDVTANNIANVKVIETEGEMQESLLGVFA